MAVAERRTQDERRAETRRALLDATVDCLLARGYQGTSLARIAETAGLTTGALQHHFKSRQQLMLAVIEEERSSPTYKLDPADQVDKSAIDRCRFAVESIWQWYANPRYPAVWDIILAARYGDTLAASIKAWRAQSSNELDEALVVLFPERHFSADWLKNLQHFLISHLRGLALMRIYEEHLLDEERLDVDVQLRLVTEAMRQMVEAAPGR